MADLQVCGVPTNRTLGPTLAQTPNPNPSPKAKPEPTPEPTPEPKPDPHPCRMGVPALAYTVQGNLLFVALAHLEAPTYQARYLVITPRPPRGAHLPGMHP